jgi:AcrR family transcriptional regulator
MPKVIHNVGRRIMDAALKIYREEGFEKISMRRIAKMCDLSVGTVYNRFEDKQDLLAQMLAGDIEYVKTTMMETVFGKQPEEALHSLVYTFVYNMMSESRNIIRHMLDAPSKADYADRILYGAAGQVKELVEELLCQVYFEYGETLTDEQSSLLADMALSLMQAAAHADHGDAHMRADMVSGMLISYAQNFYTLSENSMRVQPIDESLVAAPGNEKTP